MQESIDKIVHDIFVWRYLTERNRCDRCKRRRLTERNRCDRCKRRSDVQRTNIGSKIIPINNPIIDWYAIQREFCKYLKAKGEHIFLLRQIITFMLNH